MCTIYSYNSFVHFKKQREKHEQERQRREAEKQERLKKASVANEWTDSKGKVVEPTPDLDEIYYPDPSAPSAPLEDVDIPDDLTTEPSEPTSKVPSIDRGTKPSTTSTSSSTSLVKPGLRTVVTPSKVMSHFLTLSQKNTFNNVETCGILAGKLVELIFKCQWYLKANSVYFRRKTISLLHM